MSYELLASAVDSLRTQVTGVTQGIQDAIQRVMNLAKVNTTYPFNYVPGTAQYDVKVISGDPTATTAGMALWVDGSIVYPVVDNLSKFTLTGTEHFTAQTQFLLIVNARFDDIIGTLQGGYVGEKAARTTDYYAYLRSLQLEPAVPYIPGLSMDRPTQTVTYLGQIYRPKQENLTFLTTNWAADASKFTVATLEVTFDTSGLTAIERKDEIR